MSKFTSTTSSSSNNKKNTNTKKANKNKYPNGIQIFEKSFLTNLFYRGIIEPNHSLATKCYGCGKEPHDDTDEEGGEEAAVKLNRCSACRIITYCSKTCQQDHWSEHKIFCKMLKKETPQPLLVASQTRRYETYAFRRYQVFQAITAAASSAAATPSTVELTQEEKWQKEIAFIYEQLRDSYERTIVSNGATVSMEGLSYLQESMFNKDNPRVSPREKSIAYMKEEVRMYHDTATTTTGEQRPTWMYIMLKQIYFLLKATNRSFDESSDEHYYIMDILSVWTLMLRYEPVAILLLERLNDEVEKIERFEAIGESPVAISEASATEGLTTEAAATAAPASGGLKGTLTELLLALYIDTNGDSKIGSAVHSTIALLAVHVSNNSRRVSSKFIDFFLAHLTIIGGISESSIRMKIQMLGKSIAQNHILL